MDNNLKKIIIDFLLLPYKFIQWTKKWHFFHVIFFQHFPILLFIIVVLFISIIYIIFSHNIEDLFGIFALYIFGLAVGGALLMLGNALIVQIFAIILNKCRNKKLSVNSKFLSENRIYNILYTINFIICFPMIIIALLI